MLDHSNFNKLLNNRNPIRVTWFYFQTQIICDRKYQERYSVKD